MNKNSKIFLLTTLTLLLISISAVSAVENSSDDNIISDNIDEVTPVEKVAADNVVKDNIKTDDVSSNVDKKVSKESKIVKNDKTIIVNNDTIDDVFSGVNYTLSDEVEEGDILDFQGSIFRNHSLRFDKPINAITSTNNAVICLNTTAGSLLGDAPGNSFVVNNGGSYSNFTGLYLNNTQFWVTNSHHVYFDNMSMVVNDSRVGSGVGQTAIRDNSTYIVLNNSFIYTRNNGGSSSFVITYATHCTIENSIIQGEGNVGNILYLNVYNAQVTTPEGNSFNTIRNNTVIGPTTATAIAYAMGINGHDNTIDGNKFYYSGTGITTAYGGSASNNIITNNEFNGRCGFNGVANSTFINNTINDNGLATVGINNIFINNTLSRATVSGANAVFVNNTVRGNTTISVSTTVSNNTLNNVTISRVANLTFNNITGTVTSTAAGTIIANNTIDTTNDYTINVTGANNIVANNTLTTTTKAGKDTIYTTASTTVIENNTPETAGEFEITDETYSNFFDVTGALNNPSITSYSTIILKDVFNNKNFKFDNVKVTVKGDNAVLNNGTITSDDTAVLTVENIIFNNTDNNNAIILNSPLNTVRNVTFIRNTTSADTTEVLITGDKNKVVNNKFELNIPSKSLNWDNDPTMASNSAIAVKSSENDISRNNISLNTTTSQYYGTINVIDIASSTSSSNNIISNNTIVANSQDYLYGIYLGKNTNNNKINLNKINITAPDAYGIQIGYVPSDNNNISSNNISLNGTTVYGISISNWGGLTSGHIFNNNTITTIADSSYAIATTTTSAEDIKNISISFNKIYSNGNYTIGIATIATDSIVNNNSLSVNGTTNDTKDSYDTIKPTTAGIILLNSDSILVHNNTLNITNGPNYVLNNTNNSNITSVFNNNIRVNSNNTNVILENSNNNIISGLNTFTSSKYSVELIQSSNNNISGNILNASNLLGGNDAVSQDESSQSNIVENNSPNLVVLTDDNYSDIFDENGLIKNKVEILILASDLYNKDLKFNNNLTFKNQNNYTIYNGTIYLEEGLNGSYDGRSVNFAGINFNNVNKPVLVDNLVENTQRLVLFANATINITGDDIVAFESVSSAKKYTQYQIFANNATLNGNNVTFAKMTRDEYNSNDYLDIVNNTIDITATSKASAVEVINTNVDITDNNITIVSDDTISAIYLKDVYAAYSFLMRNNIDAQADTVDVITLINNHGSTPVIGYNNITVTANNPVKAIYVENAKDVYIGQGRYSGASYNYVNIIIINADNGETPIIDTKNATVLVRNNYLTANDISGQEAVNASTSTNNTPYRTTLELNVTPTSDITEEITVTATALNGTSSVTGLYTIYINDEVVSQTTANNIEYTFTPNEYGNYTIKATYTNTTNTTKASEDETTISFIKPETTIVVDEVNATVGDKINLTAHINYGDEAVNAGKVVFKINGQTVKDENGKAIYVKVQDGIATIENVEVLESWANKDITIEAVYSGSSKYDSARSEKTQANITNKTDDTTEKTLKVEFDYIPSIVRGEEVTFTINVTYGDEEVNTGKIAVKLNGKTLKDSNGKIIYATVENGVATITTTIASNHKVGTFTLEASFTSAKYNNTATSTTIDVVKE